MSENGPYIVFYVLAIVLVASSLVGIRQPLGRTVKMALAWVAIFAVGFALFAFRGEFFQFGERLRAEATGSAMIEGETIRIPIREDGHFWVEARLNGRAARFMVDSGASQTTVSRETAEASGMTMVGDRVKVSTANGPAWVVKGRADRLQVGPIERADFPVHINENDSTNLLGMNFLSSLRGWRVDGNDLVLQP